MKKVTQLLLMLCIATIANAQYYYLPYTSSPGQNPGGINNDSEYPVGNGLPAGWTSIHAGSAAAPAWTSTQTIPFSFNFNGVNFTQYKVSTSGVLTFDLSAATVPSYTNVTLPNATIPDNSVMAWGIAGSGANDNIVVKTFGSAPNRQHWIFFSSYTAPGTTCYVYWSIVLEETTNKIYVVDQRNGGCTQTVTVGLQINSSTAVSVVGSPNINNLSGADPTPVDNQYYEFIQGTQSLNEMELTSLNINQFVVAPNSVNIGGKVRNNGSQPITSFIIKYENNGNVYSDVKTGLNITFPNTYTFTHSSPLNIPVNGSYPVKVWIELSGDANQNNDTLSSNVSGLTFLPTKRVVFEEPTGTWCGWCPRGAVFMDSLHVLHPDHAMLIAVHNSDPMVVSNYDAPIGGLIGGYPSGLVDRLDIDVDPSTFIAEYNARINDIAPCNVDVTTTYDVGTRLLTATVNATFAADVAGDYRFNAVVVENDVTGTGSTWNQTNYYSFASNNLPLQGAGHNWQNEPNPVPAANMVYDHVARSIMGGFDGAAGSLPSNISANSNHSYAFTYTVPATQDPSSIHVIGWVSVEETGAPVGRILNSNKSGVITGLNQIAADKNFSVKVLGNPANKNSLVLVNLKKAQEVVYQILDVNGKVVQAITKNLPAGEFVYQLSAAKLSAGIYTVNIIAGKEQVSKRILITE